eukprot:4859821-Prymnesium_polylepis.1
MHQSSVLSRASSSAASHARPSTSNHHHGRLPTHHSNTRHTRGGRHLSGQPSRTACRATAAGVTRRSGPAASILIPSKDGRSRSDLYLTYLGGARY